jgi:hypothetical protein
MRRPGYRSDDMAREDLPPPLPPETRTIGQLVAEAIQLYRRRFWPSLALGAGPAVLGLVSGRLDRWTALVVVATLGGAVLAVSYTAASALAGETRFVARRWALAVAAGALVFVPFPFLLALFILPGLAWLALVGLVVPVIVLERRPLGASFRRALELARADFVHAFGSIATLAVVVFLTQTVLAFVLRDQADQTITVGAFLASLVVSPLLFLGAALLYFDQAARVGLRTGAPVPADTPPPARRA